MTHLIDVGSVLRATVASLYSNLVTRPTGAAVRTAIERQVVEIGAPVVTTIDFSQVNLLDFSCADEIVAKLLLRYRDDDGPSGFLLFRGINDGHLDPIETVLERHDLALVAWHEGQAELHGAVTDDERDLWELVRADGPLGIEPGRCMAQCAPRRGRTTARFTVPAAPDHATRCGVCGARLSSARVLTQTMAKFSGFSPPLQVIGFIATRSGDPERGPMIRMRPEDALIRLVTDGELVRVVSDRRSEIAVLEVDDTLPRGGVVLRDVVGASPSEIVRVLKLDTDTPRHA
jgi:hypothetical protein